MIHKKITELRKQKGLTQQEMADALNKSLSAYSRMERGECNLMITDLLMISRQMGVPLQSFFESLTHPHSIHVDDTEAETVALELKLLQEKIAELTAVVQSLQKVVAAMRKS